MIYPALGARTDFSLGESTISVKELVVVAGDLNTDVVGICDTMSVSALIDASNAFDKVDKTVVIGARIRVILEATKDAKPTYIKLWPTSERGLQSLYRIISRGFEADRFYYVPRVTWEDLATLADGEHLVLTTGDLESAVQTAASMLALTELCDRVRFAATFYELVPSDTPYWSRQNTRAWAFGNGQGAQPIVIQPMFWQGDGAAAYSINASIAEKRPYVDYLRPVPEYRPMQLPELVSNAAKAADAMQLRYGQKLEPRAIFKEGIHNTGRLVGLTQAYRWEKQAPSLPVVAVDPDAALIAACKAGWVERFGRVVFGDKPAPAKLAAEYMPRLQFELDILKKLGFAQYFLLVSDLVRWSKRQGIFVGPGRGSVGGSLVAYLMGITDVDPVRFGLLFERFISPDRPDLPDADLDFMSTRREEVVEYLTRTYGEARVAGIVNYNSMGAKAAVRDVGRINGLTGQQTDPIKFVPDTHGVSASLSEAREQVPEIEAFAQAHPGVWDQAIALEGKMRSYGQHAAGIVVAGCDLVERSIIERRSGSRVINWDMRVSESQGLVKLDVLGLSTLDIFDYALKLIFERHGVKIDLNALPLDDEPTLKVFTEARTAGVFQFDGGGVRRLLKQMARGGLLAFDDLVALNALNRPGPLDAGLTEQYIERRAGNQMVRYDHPVLEPVLRGTYGVVCYQEQVMQTARALCGFTPGEAEKLRKIMGKKLPEEMAKQRDKFVQGAHSASAMPIDEAGRLFDAIEKFAGYAFNKSHSVEYSLISYQSAWLKTHYPAEFYCASLSTAKTEKLPGIIKQANEDGIQILPPDINVSTDAFMPLNDRYIMAPLSAVMNVSHGAANAVMAARRATDATIVESFTGRGKNRQRHETVFGPGRFVSIDDVRARVPTAKLNSRAVENLDKIGAFARIVPGSPAANDPSRKRDQIALMPGIMDQGVIAERVIEQDEVSTDAMIAILDDMRTTLGANAVEPYLGSDMRFMVVCDAPFSDYMRFTDTFAYKDYLAPALGDAGLSVEHGIWTWAARRPKNKGEREIPKAEVLDALPFLKREMALTKPPVILTLGPAATRLFFPDMKSVGDHIGSVAYSAELDASVIIGFNPMQLYHDPSKRELLANILREVKRLIDKETCAA